MNPILRMLLLAIALFGESTAAVSRNLCTPDSQFTICPWGKISGCDLLDSKRLGGTDLTPNERTMIEAVMTKVQGKVFNLRDLANEFGARAILDKPAPGFTQVTWVRETQGSLLKTTIGFVAEAGMIQVAGVSVPGKFVVQWCNKPK